MAHHNVGIYCNHNGSLEMGGTGTIMTQLSDLKLNVVDQQHQSSKFTEPEDLDEDELDEFGPSLQEPVVNQSTAQS